MMRKAGIGVQGRERGVPDPGLIPVMLMDEAEAGLAV
jgi:hypothetical protein